MTKTRRIEELEWQLSDMISRWKRAVSIANSAFEKIEKLEDRIFDLENVEIPCCAHEFWLDGFEAGKAANPQSS